MQALVVSPFVGQRLRPFSATGDPSDLRVLADLLEAGTVAPVVDRVFPLDQGARALDYFSGGHARGKVLIRCA